MSQRAPMKVCPNCAAPNPMRQAVCFSCGYVLDKPVGAMPPRGDTLARSDDITPDLRRFIAPAVRRL